MGTCRCGADWGGRRLEHCTACHITFTSSAAGDMHRAGRYFPSERRCLSVDEMVAKGMKPNGRGYWTSGGSRPEL